MPGLVALFRRDGGAALPGEIERMAAAIQHRGPDGSGTWVEGPVGLGHRSLWTTPESVREGLPFCDAEAGLTITADARLDNREELAGVLGLSGPRSCRRGDGALILRAYERWGTNCPDRLLGDFAFVIWDRRRQQLFCARDHFGVKPLVYYCSTGLFACASEVGALLALPDVPQRIDEQRILDYLAPELEGIDGTSTFFLEIRRLPPAETLVVRSGDVAGRRYWRLDPEVELRYPRESDYVEGFRERLSEAVRCRLRSAGPAGSMLSGGIDSSAVVAVARDLFAREGKGPLPTFSAVSADEVHCPETRAVRAVFAEGGLDAFTVTPAEAAAYRAGFERVSLEANDLFDDLIADVPLLMYAAAQRRGVRVLLDGVDGDLVASHGLDYLAGLLRGGHPVAAWREAAAASRFYARFGVSPARLFVEYGLAECLPLQARKAVRRALRNSLAERVAARRGIDRDFARRVGLERRLEGLLSSYDAGRGSLRHRHAARLQHPNLQAALERYERVAAAFSVEPRHPLLDKRLVEFCLALPWQQLVGGGWPKLILRRAMQGMLPDEVRWRRGWEHLGRDFRRSWLALEEEALTSGLSEGWEALSPYVAATSPAAMGDAEARWHLLVLSRFLARHSQEHAPVRQPDRQSFNAGVNHVSRTESRNAGTRA